MNPIKTHVADIKHENHQMIVSTKKVKVDDTGIVLN